MSPPKPKPVCSTRIISQGNKFSCNSAADPNWFAECTGTCISVNMTFHCLINYWGINCVTLLSCYLCSCPNCTGEAWEGKRCWRCHLESCSNGSNSWKGMTWRLWLGALWFIPKYILGAYDLYRNFHPEGLQSIQPYCVEFFICRFLRSGSYQCWNRLTTKQPSRQKSQ